MENQNVAENAATGQTAMVVVASESWWPNLQGIVHWHQSRGGLSELFVYYTSEVSSRLSAFRLSSLVAKVFPEIKILLPTEVRGPMPEEFAAQVAEWNTQYPGRQWIVNAGQDSKLMFLATASLLSFPSLTIICQEASDAWYQSQRSPADSSIQTTRLEGIRPDATDFIPPAIWIESQFSTVEQTGHFTSSAPKKLPLLRMTELGFAHRWNWPFIFQECQLDGDEKPGALFIQYLGAALLEMGFNNVAVNLRQVRAADQPDRNPLDLAVNHGGRLVVLDVQLRDHQDENSHYCPPMTAQIQSASGLRNRLGGASVHYVLIRPCRSFSEAELLLAKTCGIEVIDEKSAPRLFSQLAGIMGKLPLPAALQDVEQKLLRGAGDKGLVRVFGNEKRHSAETTSELSQEDCLDLDNHLAQQAAARGQNWILVIWRNQLSLRIFNFREGLPEGLEKELRACKDFQRYQRVRNALDLVFARNDSVQNALASHLGAFKKTRLPLVDWLRKFMPDLQGQPPAPNSESRPPQKPASPVTPAARQPLPKPAPAAKTPNRPAGRSRPADLSDLEKALDL